jgi:maleamate amidohydrolase
LRAVHEEAETYQRQGFGASLDLRPPYGLLIVDFVNGFADPALFGGGNIAAAIETTKKLLAHARQQQWAIAHTRIVFADDGSDHNIFSLKVPGLLTLKENALASAIVSELAPEPGELVVRKQVPSAFFGTGLAAWLTQRGVQTLVVAGASPAAAYAPALSMPCRSGFARLSSPIASEIAPLARTTRICSIWSRNTRR